MNEDSIKSSTIQASAKKPLWYVYEVEDARQARFIEAETEDEAKAKYIELSSTDPEDKMQPDELIAIKNPVQCPHCDQIIGTASDFEYFVPGDTDYPES